jgi:hypothetical protein
LHFCIELSRTVEVLLDGLHGEVGALVYLGAPERDGSVSRQIDVCGAACDELNERSALRRTAGVLGGQCSEATRHDLMCFLFFVF